MKILRIVILLAITGCPWARSQDQAPAGPAENPDAAAQPAKPNVERLDETHFKIGGVTFDSKTREIRFPAKVGAPNMPLEYLIVHANGKAYESLLYTTISPTHLNLALTLLHYRPSRELYALPNETGGISDKFPDVPADVKAAARITIDVEWPDNGKTRRVSASQWVQNTRRKAAMPAGPWVYGGSEFYEGKFIPESTGDIAAIFIAQSALINYPGADDTDDTVWMPFPKRVPPEDTNVTVIIAPYVNQKPKTSKP